MRNFIVIGMNRGIVLQVLIAIHAFTDANCIVISHGESRILRFSKLCSVYREISPYGEDDEKLVAYVNSLADRLPDLFVICADCDGARIIWRVHDRLTAAVAPSPNATMIDCFDNKWRFYQFCREHGVKVPLTKFFGSKQELDFTSTALELGVPFVIKPVNEAGSKGVHVVFTEHDYRRQVLENPAYRHAPLIAQTYVRGTEVGLDLLSVRGRVMAIAIQQRHYPQNDGARISFIRNAYLEGIAHSICLKSGYNGVMNIDARIEEGTRQVFLIESNPRYWRSLLASAWCGLNFVEESVNSAPPCRQMRMLTSGNADTFYHPLFRPKLLRSGFSDHAAYRRRLVRSMMVDICTLAASIRSILTKSALRFPPATVAAQRLGQHSFQESKLNDNYRGSV